MLYNSPSNEVDHAVEQFLTMSSVNSLKSHLCIIDNSPHPQSRYRNYDPRVSYYFANRNLGYGRAHNIALRAAQGRARYSLIMNTDITYSPEVVSELKTILDSTPSAGLAAPRICYPDGALQYVCRLLPTPTNVFLRRFLPRSIWTERSDSNYELRWWNHNSIANIPFLQGSFLLLRTSLCSDLGGFDERFFLYAEDIDLCRRMHSVAETLYVPHVCITHEYRRYSKHSFRGTWYSVHSHCQYFHKWGWLFDRDRDKINTRAVNNLRESVPRDTTGGDSIDAQ